MYHPKGKSITERVEYRNVANTLTDPDSTPGKKVYLNGADSGITISSTHPATGVYTFTYTVDAGWVDGDDFFFETTAQIGGADVVARSEGHTVGNQPATLGTLDSDPTDPPDITDVAGIVQWLGARHGLRKVTRDYGNGQLLVMKNDGTTAWTINSFVEAGNAETMDAAVAGP